MTSACEKKATLRNEAIDWLLNEAPGLLGESGISYSPTAGGKRGSLADNWAFIERAHKAQGAVRRARRLDVIWRRIPSVHRQTLVAYYNRRRTWPPGFEVCFGDVVGVVFARCDDQVRWMVTQVSKHQAALRRVKREAEATARSAHEAWNNAAEFGALDEECPRRHT